MHMDHIIRYIYSYELGTLIDTVPHVGRVTYYASISLKLVGSIIFKF